MIYGYPRAIVNPEYGLQEMREVSLEFGPNALRRIARFLQVAADRIESGEWRTGHLHIDSLDTNWSIDFPECDLVVLHPSPEPPGQVKNE